MTRMEASRACQTRRRLRSALAGLGVLTLAATTHGVAAHAETTGTADTPIQVALASEPATSRALVPSAGRATIHLAKPRADEDVLRHLGIERGKSAFVRTDYSVKRVSVGNPKVVDVVVLSPRELQFVARGVGATNVVLWDPTGEPQAAIDVHVGRPHSDVEAQIRDVLGNENIRVDSAGGAVVLKGTVSSALAMERALQVAEAFFPDQGKQRVLNLLDVGGDQQVMIEVTVAEMQRSLSRALGTNFATTIRSGNQTISIVNFLDGITNFNGFDFETVGPGFDLVELLTEVGIGRANLAAAGFGFGSGVYEFFFDVAESEGLAKVLAEPTLVARSGETATFLVGAEVGIPVTQSGQTDAITIEFKEFGTGVLFTPTVLSADRIHMEVTTQVSEVGPDIVVGGEPSSTFPTRRATTAVELGDGQSFAIAGLLRETLIEDANKYPVLGDLPILGTLFRSSAFLKEQTELVIIVTPRLVRPLGPGPHPLPTDHFIEPSAFEFYLLGALEGRTQSGMAGGGQDRDHLDMLERRDPDAAPKLAREGGLIGEAGHRVSAWPQGETR